MKKEMTQIAVPTLIERFAEWMRGRGEEITARLYASDISLLIEHFERAGIDLTKASQADIAGYFRGSGYKRTTAQRKIMSISKFTEFAALQGDIELAIPREDITGLRQMLDELEPPEQKVISEEDFLEAIRAIKEYSPPCHNINSAIRNNLRARSIIAASLFYRTGALPNKAIALDEKDFSVRDIGKSAAEISVNFNARRGNTIYRTTGLEADTAQSYHSVLRRLKEYRGTTETETALLVNQRGERISQRRLRKIISQCSGFSPATFRRSCPPR